MSEQFVKDINGALINLRHVVAVRPTHSEKASKRNLARVTATLSDGSTATMLRGSLDAASVQVIPAERGYRKITLSLDRDGRMSLVSSDVIGWRCDPSGRLRVMPVSLDDSNDLLPEYISGVVTHSGAVECNDRRLPNQLKNEVEFIKQAKVVLADFMLGCMALSDEGLAALIPIAREAGKSE